MSRRHLRKVFGGNELPPPDSDEEEEYVGCSGQSKFSGLEISSDSDENRSVEDAEDQKVCAAPVPKTKKKKKKKKNKNQVQQQTRDKGEKMEFDETSLMEVSQILGACSLEASTSKDAKKKDELADLMWVHVKYLTPNREFVEKFGKDESRDRNRGRQAIMDRLNRKMYLVQPRPFFSQLTKQGLSMSIYRREGDLMYFTYDHDSDYQKLHKRNLVEDIVKKDLTQGTHELMKYMYVEGLIQAIDTFFAQGVNSNAVLFLEITVAYMQLCAHPSFVLYDPKVRLEYKFPENRPFFIAMLKYIHMLTNTACHRSALEIAKLLLNLDSSDPLAVLLIIDTIALRARQHEWLIDAIDYWTKHRNAGEMLNIQYSYAMAHFHVLSNNNEDLGPADKLLYDAILKFPTAAFNLMEMTNMRVDESVKKHPLLTTFANTTTSRVIKDLSHIYCKFSYQKWREPPVLNWFTKVLMKLLDDYRSDPDFEKISKKAATMRCNLFEELPREIARHWMVIKPMAALLIDDELPSTVPYGIPWNPLEEKDNTVHRYYGPPRSNAARSDPSQLSRQTTVLLEWIGSMAPAYRPRYTGETTAEAVAAGIQHFFETGALVEGEDDDRWDVVLPSDDEE